MMRIKKRHIHDATTYVMLGFAVLVTLIPFLGILLASLNGPFDRVRPFTLPDQLTGESYIYAWTQGHFGDYLTTSVLVTVSCTVGVLVLSIMAGYGFAKYNIRGGPALLALLLVGFAVPNEAIIVPLYYEFRTVGLTDTYWALILPTVGSLLPFGVLWMRAAFRAIPPWLSEAAMLDRANSWYTLWRILVPVAKPAMLTLTVMVAMWSWNMFLLPLVMSSGPGLRTAPLGLAYFRTDYETNIAALAAGSVLVALPIVVLFIFLQRHFIQGILSGGVVE